MTTDNMNVYSYMKGTNLHNIESELQPGIEESGMPMKETPLTHLMSSGFAHRITRPREMEKILRGDYE